MISGIGSASPQRMTDVMRTSAPKAAAAVKGASAAQEAAPTNPAALMAAQGAPIDTDKVASIKAAIAAGTYTIDPGAIADRMIALDLPAR